ADTADTFIRAATSDLVGAHVFNLHGETVAIADVVAEIERLLPEARGKVTYAAESLGIAEEMDDTAIRNALGALPATPLPQVVQETIGRFVQLHSEGRLDTSELDQ